MLLHLTQHTSRIDVMLLASSVKSSELSNAFDAFMYLMHIIDACISKNMSTKKRTVFLQDF